VIVAAAAQPPNLSPRTRRDETRAARARGRDPMTADPEVLGRVAVDADATPVELPAGRRDATITGRAPTSEPEKIPFQHVALGCHGTEVKLKPWIHLSRARRFGLYRSVTTKRSKLKG
jgi:hypothetical protein